MQARNLLIDIECAPAKVWSWSLYPKFIGIDQIIEPPRMISFAARWYGEKKTVFYSEYHDTRLGMLDALHALMSEANIVTHFNGKRFDVPWLIGELERENYPVLPKVQQIDLFQIAKSNMRFISNKLDYISQDLLGQRKVQNGGFALWKACLEEEDTPAKAKAWALMKKYNIQDVDLMVPLFERLRPYVKGVNFALIEGLEFACTKCASSNLIRRGFSRTGAGKFQRYQCSDCGGWSTDSKRLATTALRA
jgi:DNA polymerase elongation subunit (family B)